MPDSIESPVLSALKSADYKTPKYSDKELDYLKGLQMKLEDARLQRDQKWDELDGATYVERWEDDEKLANAHIASRLNKSDTDFNTGTVRHKLLALLAALRNLSLESEFIPYDKDDVQLSDLGMALGVIIERTKELDDDAEKQLHRQYVLFSHGHVYVEEDWREEWANEKYPNKRWDGKFEGFDWTERLEKIFEGPSRNVLYGPSVYLGSMREFFINKQPYVFTLDDKSYEATEAIYKNWDRWQFVTRDKQTFDATTDYNDSLLYNTWRFTNTKKGRCEILKFQCKSSNEFQIVINGVPMLPVGFPLTAISPSGEYTIVQQNNEVITPQFAIGRSFVSRLKTTSALLDEMLRLLVLKAQRNFLPPLANLTGRVLSAKVFLPGVITHGVNPDLIKPMIQKQTDDDNATELQTIEMLSENMDQNSVNPTFAGQQVSGDPTATQILETQRQAKQMLGLSIFVAAMLEKKCDQLRLYNIIGNWFEPVDEVVDKTRNILKKKYRSATVSRPIEGEGMGQVTVYASDDMEKFNQDKSMEVSKDIYKEEKKSKSPVRRIYVNCKEVKEAASTWRTVVNPSEQPSSERSKVLTTAMLRDGIELFGQDLNMEYAKEKFAQAWQVSQEKLFNRSQSIAVMPALGGMQNPQNSPTNSEAAGGMKMGATSQRVAMPS